MNAESILYSGPVIGVKFPPTKTRFKELIEVASKMNEEEIDIVPFMKADPNNPYDPNCINIIMKLKEDFFHIGYIPKASNQAILLHGIENCTITLERLNVFEEKPYGFTITVEKKAL